MPDVKFRADHSKGALIAYDTALSTKTASYTMTLDDEYILANGAITVTLPDPSTVTGKPLTVKRIGAGSVTVARNGTETIDGSAANKTIGTAQHLVSLVSDGTNWHLLHDGAP